MTRTTEPYDAVGQSAQPLGLSSKLNVPHCSLWIGVWGSLSLKLKQTGSGGSDETSRVRTRKGGLRKPSTGRKLEERTKIEID